MEEFCPEEHEVLRRLPDGDREHVSAENRRQRRLQQLRHRLFFGAICTMALILVFATGLLAAYLLHDERAIITMNLFFNRTNWRMI
jgi:hypothetical protein